MQQSPLDPANRFIIQDYQHQRPFASFLPGIAGPTGIPMWAFYVNRGQGISSFGIESKDSPIMEFQPANKAYQSTPYLGFRTFLKISREGKTSFYEPFSLTGRGEGANQQMATGANELEIQDASRAQGIKTTVLYFTLPGEAFAGLARYVTIENTGETPAALELLDGMPAVIPYGVTNGLLKDIGRTVEAWMEVFNHDVRTPFYRLRASVVDKAEVETYEAGHFGLAVCGNSLLPALVDPAVVFESDTSFFRPDGFCRQPLDALLACPQVTCGRTPCAFFAHQARLAPGESLTLYCLYGHASGLEVLQPHIPRIANPAYFEGKHQEAVKLADDLTDVVSTHTADPVFDAYVRQNFLDNVLRGGWPVLLGNPQSPHVYPIYSRKHGDQERDYNAYFIAPEPYSQGEGSYRDVNQNRRDNVLLNPHIGDFDIRTFMSLIQLDGYNPRVVKGSSFTLAAETMEEVLANVPAAEPLRKLLSKPFTPGKLLKTIADHDIQLPLPAEAFLVKVMAKADQHLEATFFEGYWIDHWEYNLDLIENYLAVYPDRRETLLFGAASLPYYESPVSVQPRSKKYVLVNGMPRQIGSLLEPDPEKAALIASRAHLPNWMRDQHGKGEIYQSALFAKMLLVALLKFASLDQLGMGIEMEAGRPGWYDALNGLPALFGSGMAETYELLRWLRFLHDVARETPSTSIRLPVEAVDLLREVICQLEIFNQSTDANRDFQYWDAVSTARETYRDHIRMGIDDAEQAVSLKELEPILFTFQSKVTQGITRAEELNGGLPPTYFTYQVDEYEVQPETSPQGYPYIRTLHFVPNVLPLFLEGPVKALGIQPDRAAALKLHQQVKTSPLFDRELKMYKVNASLSSQPHDIGRARAFPSGWLENESIWLHMEYKYLLQTLRAGLYEAFFEDFRSALVPFLDPQVYGRSTLENSSFLASSAHPDPALHGAGFVARLSGSTAEFQSMWNIMMAGKQPFHLQNGQLCLTLRPALPGWLFTEAGEISFRFLGCCTVTYHNSQRADTYADAVQPRHIVLYKDSANPITLQGDTIPAPHAEAVRSGSVQQIEVFF